MNPDSEEQYIVRARGLPWSATAENVAEFFSGYIFLCVLYCCIVYTIVWTWKLWCYIAWEI